MKIGVWILHFVPKFRKIGVLQFKKKTTTNKNPNKQEANFYNVLKMDGAILWSPPTNLIYGVPPPQTPTPPHI